LRRVGIREEREVTASGYLDDAGGTPRSFFGDPGGLSYGVRESHEIVDRVRRLVLVER